MMLSSIDFSDVCDMFNLGIQYTDVNNLKFLRTYLQRSKVEGIYYEL